MCQRRSDGSGWHGCPPVLGALLYVGFGINRVKRRARRLKGSVRSVAPLTTGDISSDDPLEPLKAAIGKITGQDMAIGKVIAVLDCGDQAYPQMLAAIESAKLDVRLSTYIFRTDEVGLQFISAWVRAQRRGVRTRVLIDGFGGGFLHSPAYHRLRKQGVPVSRFMHSILPWKTPFLDLRLHKKSLVVDGDSAFVGGLNIGVENLIAQRPKAPVGDVHFRLRGTVVRQIEQEFDDNWSFATGEEPIGRGPAPTAPPWRSAARTIPPGRIKRSISWFFVCDKLGAAFTPYFLPEEQVITALQLAVLRCRFCRAQTTVDSLPGPPGPISDPCCRRGVMCGEVRRHSITRN
jgi:cardiolipin synthase A/B